MIYIKGGKERAARPLLDEGIFPTQTSTLHPRLPQSIDGRSGRHGPIAGVWWLDVRALHGKAHLQHVLAVLGYKQINTSVVERHNGTSRLRNQRKVRKTLAFSKANRYHRWMSWLSVGLYNFCRAHESLKIKQDTRVQHRSPTIAAGLTDRIWATHEWLLCPLFGRL